MITLQYVGIGLLVGLGLFAVTVLLCYGWSLALRFITSGERSFQLSTKVPGRQDGARKFVALMLFFMAAGGSIGLLIAQPGWTIMFCIIVGVAIGMLFLARLVWNLRKAVERFTQ